MDNIVVLLFTLTSTPSVQYFSQLGKIFLVQRVTQHHVSIVAQLQAMLPCKKTILRCI